VVLLWDRAAIHRSRAVATLLQAYRARLEAVLLPPYAPDLNPDEWAWAHLKCRELANHTAPDTPSLQRAIRRAVCRMRRRPVLIRSFLRASELPW
jgi:transposase